MWDFVKRGRTRTRPSFVQGWAQRQEEMKRASCAVPPVLFSILDLLRFSHGRVEKHTNVFKLSRYHLRHPPPFRKTTTNQGERKGGQIACIWAAVVLLHCVVVNAWERRATRVCLLHDSIAIHERGPQSRSADDVKVEWAVATANTFSGINQINCVNSKRVFDSMGLGGCGVMRVDLHSTNRQFGF
jgi:hypothetical protein